MAAPDLTAALTARGFHHLGAKPLTQGSEFSADIYVHPSCRGAMMIVPMVRNGEGVSLLKSMAAKKKVRVRFAFDGDVSADFPSLRFWAARAFDPLVAKSAMPGRRLVLGIAESGTCQMSETLDWNQVLAK